MRNIAKWPATSIDSLLLYIFTILSTGKLHAICDVNMLSISCSAQFSTSFVARFSSWPNDEIWVVHVLRFYINTQATKTVVLIGSKITGIAYFFEINLIEVINIFVDFARHGTGGLPLHVPTTYDLLNDLHSIIRKR